MMPGGNHDPTRGTRPPAIEWRDVSLDLEGLCLDRVTLALERGAWLGVLGPTGAGKTLLLEVAAGFVAPTAGRVLRDGHDVTRQPPEARRLAYVPQDDLLFPHLTVRRNLLFATRHHHRPPGDVATELERIAAGLRIEGLLERRVQAISGGEAQRVALGRALLAGTDTLLLDECTSALDETTRDVAGDFLTVWWRQRDLTIVQVTHDVREAERLAGRIVRLEQGRLVGESGTGRQRSRATRPATTAGTRPAAAGARVARRSPVTSRLEGTS